MAAKPTKKLTVLIQEAKKLVKHAEADLAAFRAKDKDRPLKTPKLIAQIKALVSDTASKLTSQTAKRAAAKQATRSEEERRADLRAALGVVRDDARDGIEEHDAKAAFGVGRNLESSSTTHLVEIADEVRAAWETYPDAAKGAGITRAKIDAVAKAQAALGAADAAQGDAIGARRRATSKKKSAAADLAKLVSRLRERAKSLVKGKTAKAAWKNSAPRAKARKKKAAAPAEPAPSAK